MNEPPESDTFQLTVAKAVVVRGWTSQLLIVGLVKSGVGVGIGVGVAVITVLVEVDEPEELPPPPPLPAPPAAGTEIEAGKNATLVEVGIGELIATVRE